jgi:Ni2+-binding GTPase involved in maturation of urease and hydrogenase
MRLNVEAIPTPKGFLHPPAPHDALPKHEFSMGLIAPKGSGKTTVLCNLLKFYKNYFHSILVFSPTVASDDKWEW